MSARLLGLAGAVVLSSAALFAAERPNILVVPAHPDDFQGCAGTCLLLRHKYDIHVCDFTAGEAGLGKEGYLNGEAKRIRYAEETNALAVVGAKLYYTGEINACDPDNAAHAGRRACETIANLIRKLKPKAVFTHWPIDHHGDHTMAATATMKAIAMSGENPEVYYFEAWDWEMSQFVPAHFIDISSVSDLRDEYIRRHRSQGPEWMETMNRTMSSWRGQRLMTPRVDQAELLGVRTPVPYGTPSVLDDIRTSPFRTSSRLQPEPVRSEAFADFVDPAAYGFSPSAAPAENAAALQKALDGGNRRVRVTKPGVYGLDRPVYIDSHTVLEFAPGAVLAKRALYHNVLVNRGAWFGGSNECITVRGLEIRANGFDVNPPPGCAAPGLHGQLSFWKVRDLRVEDYTCNDVGKEQYGIQVVGFDGFTIDGFTIRGRRDGVHLNSGRNFTVRRGVLRTLDDGVALNAGEWPDCTPEMGSLENGVVEQITDEDGGACNFVRVITGRWREWHAGMRLQRCDLVMRGPRVYAIFPHAAGTNETVSLVAPPSDHPGRVWTSPEGLNFHLLQTNGVDRADVRNVVIRDCTILGDRGISCMWEHGDYARLVHPDVPAADYPEIDIRVENVVKKTSSPLVHGFASAKIRLENVVTKGALMQLAGFSQFHPAAFDIEVARCTFAKDGERRAADFFFNGIGSVKLRFASDVRAERDIDVYRSKKLQGFSLDLPPADIRVRVR